MMVERLTWVADRVGGRGRESCGAAKRALGTGRLSAQGGCISSHSSIRAEVEAHLSHSPRVGFDFSRPTCKTAIDVSTGRQQSLDWERTDTVAAKGVLQDTGDCAVAERGSGSAFSRAWTTWPRVDGDLLIAAHSIIGCGSFRFSAYCSRGQRGRRG